MGSYIHERTTICTVYGTFHLHCFAWGQHEEDNVLVLEAKAGVESTRPLVRVQSACYTAEIFRSLDCDCHAQLAQSLELISEAGGLLIYMLCDGRGAGLLNKIRGMELAHTQGLDTHDAYQALRIPTDPRSYERVAEILREMEYPRVSLLTNNPRKVEGVKGQGLDVVRKPLEIRSTDHSRPYLQTKALKMGHLLSEFRGRDSA